MALLALALLLMALPSSARLLHVAQSPLPEVPEEEQFASVSEAVAAGLEPGDTVQIHSGLYREQVIIEASGTEEAPITIEAAPNARVTLTGADKLTDWQRESEEFNLFSTPWDHLFIGWSETRSHPGDDYHLLIGRAEQVFASGLPLRQVLRKEELARGTFWVDEEGKRLFVWTADNVDLTQGLAPIEASARSSVLELKGNHLHIRGLNFRYAANQAQSGGVLVSGNHCVFSNCAITRMNANGLTVSGDDCILAYCRFEANGEVGLGGTEAHNLLVTDCLVRGNNSKGWNRGWEGGGSKLCLSRGIRVMRSQFVENIGTGLWFDIGNEAIEVANCLFLDNLEAGLFYEISYGLHAHDNVAVGNGLADTAGAWGMQAGIVLSSSPGCTIERNLLVGNREGFAFREQFRTTPQIEDHTERPVWNHDNVIRNNVLAWNRDAQLWGWFAQEDERHWPKALQQQKVEEGPEEDIAADYVAKDPSAQPVGLSLEDLNLLFEANVFCHEAGQGLFYWGSLWSRIKRYESLGEVQAELPIGPVGVEEACDFPSLARLELSLPAGSSAFRLKCYPRGEIPGVELGVLE